jgi:hypothetical protein
LGQGAETDTLPETSTEVDADTLTDGSIDGVDTLTLTEGSTDADADTLTEVETSMDDELMLMDEELMSIELIDESAGAGRVDTSPEAADCNTWPRSSPSGCCAV